MNAHRSTPERDPVKRTRASPNDSGSGRAGEDPRATSPGSCVPGDSHGSGSPEAVQAAVQAGRREQTPKSEASPYEHGVLEPMWLVGLDELEAFGKLPRSSDRAAVGAIDLASLNDEVRSRTLIVFLSHRWMMASLDPSKAHPDTHDNIKHALVVQGLRRLAHGLPADTERVLIWVDWMGMDQDNLSALRRGMSSLSGYIERCDALFTPYTDEFEARRASDSAQKMPASVPSTPASASTSVVGKRRHRWLSEGIEGEEEEEAEHGGTGLGEDARGVAAADIGVEVSRRARLDRATESFLELARSQPALHIFSRYASLAEYMSRGWCRLEVFMAANSRLPEHGYNYFARMAVARTDRPHFFFGDFQQPRSELPEVGPKIANSVLAMLSPAAGAVTVDSDRLVLAKLVAAFPVPLSQPESYDGATNSKGLPHGQGKKVYEDGRVYEGAWADGEYHGEGSLLYANGTLYRGGFRKGKRNGKGIHYLSNGLRFEGHFDDGESHGAGKLYAQSGKLKVEGNKVRTKWEGEGYVEYHPSGAVCFRGSAHNNARHGHGTEYADQQEKSGQDGHHSSIVRQGRWEAGVYVGR